VKYGYAALTQINTMTVLKYLYGFSRIYLFAFGCFFVYCLICVICVVINVGEEGFSPSGWCIHQRGGGSRKFVMATKWLNTI
jgi:hypothetical protein